MDFINVNSQLEVVYNLETVNQSLKAIQKLVYKNFILFLFKMGGTSNDR